MKTRSSTRRAVASPQTIGNLSGDPCSSASSKRKRKQNVATPTSTKNHELNYIRVPETSVLPCRFPLSPRVSSPDSHRVSTPHIHLTNNNVEPSSNVFSSPNFCADISVADDSFLNAINKMEKHNNTNVSRKFEDDSLMKAMSLDKWEEKVKLDFESSNFFDNSQEIVDILPASQSDSPVTSRKRNSLNANRVLTQRKINECKEVLEQNADSRAQPKPFIQLTISKASNIQINKLQQDNTTGKPKKKKKRSIGAFKVAYTNRKLARQLSESGQTQLSTGDLTMMTTDEKLLLSSWGLPSSIVAKYKAKGVTSLFPWQLDCLANPKVLDGCNLLYSAPTSAGKTLVAEILMLKRVLELGKKAIMILPFVSVAREKMYSLQELFDGAGVRVEGFMGSHNPPGGFKAVDIAICTIEKANSLINRLLEDSSLSDLGTIVVDEMHLIGDAHRGYLLEIMLTKVLFMNMKSVAQNENNLEYILDGREHSKKLNVQIVGMSATLPNLKDLASWLKAELVTTDYRPVPLVERIKIQDSIYDKDLQLVRKIDGDGGIKVVIPNDDNDIIRLSLETILGGHSILIFCPTKASCEVTAEKIAEAFFNIGNPQNTSAPEIGQALRGQLHGGKLGEVLTQLEQCPAGIDSVLKKTVAYGVSFHHAGLTFDERDIIESAFRRCVLRVIVATSTLSAGVNLPARRVIITTPCFNGTRLDSLTYCQMAGRAGRKGVDTEGESILLCQLNTKEIGMQLFKAELNSVRSALLNQTGTLTTSMKRALLEVIASGVAKSPREVYQYSHCTLLSLLDRIEQNQDCSQSQRENGMCIDECLKFLEDNEFIKLKHYENSDKEIEFMTTNLGAACLASSLSPDEGIFVFKELQKAVQCFVLDNELHIIYQVTPTYLSEHMRYIDFSLYLRIWEGLNDTERRVADLIGVSEAFIIRGMTGVVSRSNSQQAQSFLIHQRFFAALALNDLVNETSISDVSLKYNLNKGVIQNLQQAASTFAGMVTAFCGRLGWSNLELLLSQFQERLQFGVQRELCDLVKLSSVNGQKARILHDSGIKTVAELASCEPAHVEHILHRAGPFHSNVHAGKSKSFWMLGKCDGMNEGEMAQLIVQEARQFLQVSSVDVQIISPSD